jgi:hypothetical protein
MAIERPTDSEAEFGPVDLLQWRGCPAHRNAATRVRRPSLVGSAGKRMPRRAKTGGQIES